MAAAIVILLRLVVPLTILRWSLGRDPGSCRRCRRRDRRRRAFPNLLENVHLYVTAARRFAPRLLPRTAARMIIVLLVLLIPKVIQEWALHWEELHPWQWFRETFVRPLPGYSGA
jgi:hypothetical protein